MDWGLLGTLVKLGGAVAVGVPFAAYLLQDKLIFLPQPLPEAQRAAIIARHPNVSDTFLQSEDGTRLHAWHLKGSPGEPLILYFGGNAEDVTWMVSEIARRQSRASWLLIEYRGYGASEGRPSETALNADALAWYDHAAKANERIYAVARSLGTGVATQLATQRRLQGIVLITPYDSMVAVGKYHYPLLPVGWLLRHRFDSLARAPQLNAPLLCIAATYDEVIPLPHARRLYEAWAGPKEWLELPVRHNGIDAHPRFWPAIEAFLGKR